MGLFYSRVEQELPNVNGAVPGSLKAEATESEMESLLVRPESVALLSSPPPQPKNPNGNNNYEMREYRRSRSQDNIWLKVSFQNCCNNPCIMRYETIKRLACAALEWNAEGPLANTAYYVDTPNSNEHDLSWECSKQNTHKRVKIVIITNWHF